MSNLETASQNQGKVQLENLLKKASWGLFIVAAAFLALLLFMISVGVVNLAVLVLAVVIGFYTFGGFSLRATVTSPEPVERKWSTLGIYLSVGFILLCGLPGFVIAAGESGQDRLIAVVVFAPPVIAYLAAALFFAAKKLSPGCVLLIVAGILNLPAEAVVIKMEGTGHHHLIGIVDIVIGILAILVGRTILQIDRTTRS